MRVGVVVPQGWVMEYRGWDPLAAWERTVGVTRQAEALGFESIWMYDHLHTLPDPPARSSSNRSRRSRRWRP